MKNYTDLLNEIQQSILDNKASAMDEHEEYKNEFYRMSLGALKSISAHSSMLVEALESNPELQDKLTQSWMQGKIAITEDYLLTIFNAVMFNDFEEEEYEEEYAERELASLWENIRKKKERMGKKYKPAKPGDKDRPDPEAWKKAQK